MNFEEALTRKKELEKISSEHSKVLRQFESNEIGLTPDRVKNTLEWKVARDNFNRSFSELRDYNAWFVKKFKKEYRNYMNELKKNKNRSD